jgi:signal transduction histidine kinase
MDSHNVNMNLQKILVVDDDPDLLNAYAHILESAGYETSRAATGRECLETARAEQPTLVLLDSMLPDGAGIDICGQIKADEQLVRTFVIIISGVHTSVESQADALDAGADGYLTKPIQRRALLAHVSALLRIKRAEEELRATAEALQESNRRLEEYNRLKAEFVANMSHELRTPLNAIIGFAQLMQMNSRRDQSLTPSQEDAIQRILRNSRHLLTLIDGVLDLSKLEAGRKLLHAEHFDVAEVVQSAFGELQSLARQKNLSYQLTVKDELPIAYSDPLRIRQIIVNLLSNAIKFTARGRVDVELRRADAAHWTLVVHDTGIGIESDQIETIFERFRQLDGSSTRSAGGAGLGLAIVREIVKQLGGYVEVTSAFGQGSSFSVTLPFVAPQHAVESVREDAAEPSDEATGAGADQPLVLVIEDDPDSAQLLSSSLAQEGYRVAVAADGAAGLRLARELRPAALTLDIMMPSLDGWRVLQTLKADPSTAGVPVIVVSVVDNRPLGYRLGASDYLVKPVEPGRLVETLHGVGASPDNSEGYVLVVDDEPSVRELLVTALRQAGFRARAASSGETALKLCAQSPPIAVLCDLMMPGGMSGFEFIARLRCEPPTARTPIVIITGKDVTAEDRRLVTGQIADVIRKGDLLLPDLQNRLREVLGELGVTPLDGTDSGN